MTVRRAIEVAAFNGRRVLKKGSIKTKVVASGTGTQSVVGVMTYDSSGARVMIAVDTAGTGTVISV